MNVDALRGPMRPYLRLVSDLVLWTSHAITPEQVREGMQQVVGAWSQMPGVSPAQALIRARQSYQRDLNRHFVVANLLDELEVGTWYADLLVEIAQVWAEVVEEALAESYPDRRFQVEVIGAGLVEEEPLEVCVSFWEV